VIDPDPHRLLVAGDGQQLAFAEAGELLEGGVEVQLFAGTGEQGRADGLAGGASFDEPGGISVADEVLYVADTNNHAIRRLVVSTGTVDTLPIEVP